MVERGCEIDVEYSKKEIINRMNAYFGNSVVEKIKIVSFNNEKKTEVKENELNLNVTNIKFNKQIENVKNEKIKKSLIKLTKVFKSK